MAEKFLYYLGAGASAQAMPTVKPIGNEASEFRNAGFIQTLREFAAELSSHKANNSDLHIFLTDISERLDALASESSSFATIDTYAKFLYLKDPDKFQRLKYTLSAFFSLLQLWKGKVDKRYLSWVTSVMSENSFPENIKILTWNYDFQVQLASETFQGESYHITGGAAYHQPPLIRYWPSVGWSGVPQVAANEISLLHLNGLAGSYFDTEHNIFNNVFLQREQMSQNSTVYPLRRFGHSTVFNFAWERGSYQDWLLWTAQQMVQDTTIVIVIGYSFPFFNRDIDKRIFEQLKGSGLRKIYFQDPYLDGSFLRAQFDLDNDIEIIHRKEVDSFYIPFEL